MRDVRIAKTTSAPSADVLYESIVYLSNEMDEGSG